MPICLVCPVYAVRERVSAPLILLADPFTVASKHFEGWESVRDVRLIEAVVAVCLLPLE